MKSRILIADDHALVLEAFKKLLSSAYEVVGTVTDGQALLHAAETLVPDLILVDITMPHLNGLDAIDRIRSRRSRARIVVLTMQEDRDTAAEAIRRGASGFVLKSATSTELFEALDTVLKGKIYITPAVADIPSGVFAAEAVRASRRAGLTLRQREVLQLLAEGKSMKEAAKILDVTPRTIAFHKYSIMRQLGFRTNADLVRHALAMGLVGQEPGRR